MLVSTRAPQLDNNARPRPAEGKIRTNQPTGEAQLTAKHLSKISLIITGGGLYSVVVVLC